MNIKHLLIISFIFSTFIITAQELKNNNEPDSVLLNNKIKINNLTINTENQDFGTVYFKDKIVFTSSRSKSKLIKRVWNLNNLPFLDLYDAERKDVDLVNVKSFDKKINQKYNEGPASFNEAGNFIAFTRNNYNAKSKDAKIKLQLFTAKFENKRWTEAEPMSFNSNEYSVGHPALTADGNTMYFVSDMPGGFGGVDIYVTDKNERGEWNTPLNLGSGINTKGNEMFPFIHDNNFLFFASTGHSGLGGLDIFYAKKNGKGFTTPQNIGSPINSNKDDFALIFNEKMDAGYFSSDREGGMGNDDIYSFTILKPAIVNIILKGKTFDKQQNILANTVVSLYDDKGNEIQTITTSKTGEYNFTIQANTVYNLHGIREKYKPGSAIVNSQTSDTFFLQDLILESIPEPLIDVSLICNFTEKETKEAITNAKIKLNDIIKEVDSVLFTDNNGVVSLKLDKYKLNDKLEFKITFKKEDYIDKTINYDTIIHKDGNYVLNVEIQKSKIIEVSEIKVFPIILNGKVVDQNNNNLADTEVNLWDTDGNKIETIITNKTGEYKFTLQPNTDYKLEGKKTNYKTVSLIVNSLSGQTNYSKNLVLELIQEPIIDVVFICNVSDKKTKRAIANMGVSYSDIIKNEGSKLFTDDNGTVRIKLKSPNLNDHLNYTLTFEKEGYTKKNVNYDTVIYKAGNYILNVEIQKIEIVADSVDIIVEGKTLDKTNKILANTDVIIYDGKGNIIKNIKTDETGEFKFNLKPETFYRLEAKRADYEGNLITIDSHAFDTLIVKDINLELIPKFNIICNVSDKETKNAISNARITLTDKNNSKEKNLYTDDKGTVLISLERKLGEHPDYTFTLEKEGYQEKTVNYETLLHSAGDYILNVAMEKTITVRNSVEVILEGKTLDKTNKILANTDVRLYDGKGNLIKIIKTDEKGEFKFKIEPETFYRLEAKRADYEDNLIIIDAYAYDTVIVKDINLELIPRFNMICNVKDQKTKDAIANAKITVYDKIKSEDGVLYTDVNGAIFMNLENKPGEHLNYSFTIEKVGYNSKTVDYDTLIHEAGDYVLNIVLEKIEIIADSVDVILEGKTLDKTNKILANTDVRLYDGKGNLIKIIKTDEKGEFKFKIEPQTFYRLEAKRADYEDNLIIIDAYAYDTVIVKDINLELIPRFNMICNVKDQKTKDAIANAKITVYDKIKSEDGVLYTDVNGAIFMNLENKPGEHLNYSFTIEKVGYNSKTVDYDTLIHEAGDYVLNIVLEKIEIIADSVDVILEGKTLDKTNKILANTDVRLYDGKGNLIKIIKTDEKGEFKFKIEPETFYRLEAKRADYEDNLIIIDAYAYDTVIVKDINLELIPRFNMICNVKDQKTKDAIANAKITVYDKIKSEDGVLYTDVNGAIFMNLENKPGEHLNYSFTIEKVGYNSKTVDYDTLIHEAGDYVLNIVLEKIEIIADSVDVILEGKTLDKTNKILANTDVRLYDGKGNLIKIIKTDEKGEFKFKIEPETFYRLEAKRADYEDNLIIIDAHAYDTVIVKDINLELIPRFNMICNVKDQKTKDAIANAKITVYDKIKSEEGVLYTDVNGAIFMNLENKPGEHLNYSFTIEKVGYNSKTVDYDTLIHEAGDYVLNIVLEKIEIIADSVDVILEGKTLDKTNKILANTDVRLYDGKGNLIKIIKTDEKGEFKFKIEPETFYRLEAKRADYEDNLIIIDAHAYDTVIVKDINLELIPIINIICNVTDKDTKELIANSKVSYYDNENSEGGELYTDNKGTFLLKLDNFKLNDRIDFTFNFEKEAYTEKTVQYDSLLHNFGNYILNIEMQKAEIAELQEIIVPPIILSGKVTDDENIILPDSKVTLYNNTGDILKTVNTNESGEYSFTLKADKVYKLVSEKEKYKTVSATVDAHTSNPVINKNITLELITGPVIDVAIICNVSDIETKEAISNSKITIRNKKNNTLSVLYSDEKGVVLIKPEQLKLNDRLDYALTFEKEGYNKTIKNYETVIHKTEEYILNIEMQKIEATQIVNTPGKIILKGQAFDGDNNILANTEIRLYYGSDNEIKVINTDENGEYSFTLEPKIMLDEGEKHIVDIDLQKIKIGDDLGKLIKINPIYFDYDKSILSSEAAVELDKIVKIMNEYPNIVIELTSHTDCRGDAGYNLELSNRRAKVTADYIKKRIKNSKRIYAKGMGESKLINHCDEIKGSDCSEYEHQKNRRTEFKIIKK